MSRLLFVAAALAVALSTPALAQGEITITHAKALAGNVTPGDAAGYPVELRRPGTYVLAGNLTVPANRAGIALFAEDVTIDLNGFRIHGGDVASYGITGFPDGVTIRNGTIRNFKFDGIRLTGNRGVVEGMQLTENGGQGVVLSAGNAHRLLNNTVIDNGSHGISCTYCIVAGNVVYSNEGVGISGSGGTFVGNLIVENTGAGLSTGTVGSGYGHNTLYFNQGATAAASQVEGAAQLDPNFCGTAACP
jgi:hypothetical protein